MTIPWCSSCCWLWWSQILDYVKLQGTLEEQARQLLMSKTKSTVASDFTYAVHVFPEEKGKKW
jgi:hypothetical protein